MRVIFGRCFDDGDFIYLIAAWSMNHHVGGFIWRIIEVRITIVNDFDFGSFVDANHGRLICQLVC
jgi:hypothetical protein